MNYELRTLDALRARMNLFVKERDWNKFHLPCNILLALLGEVGEVAECFQWKGPMIDFEPGFPVKKYFTNKEVEHVGEEIADVIIYTTRLAEELRVDLGAAVSNRIDQQDREVQSAPSSSSSSASSSSESKEDVIPTKWSACAFADLQSFSRTMYQAQAHRSPRFFALTLHTVTAKLSSLFSRRPESDTLNPWKLWPQPDTVELVAALVDVLLCMGGLANLMGLELAKCASDKIAKNCLKYPAAAVKGSSAKYTAYNGSGSNDGTKLYVASSQALLYSSTAVIFAGVLGAFAGLFLARKER